jgi:pimeloyl-ACP methyl ester carboxylesterase
MKKALGWLVLLAVAVMVVGLVVFHQRPVWASFQETHAELFLDQVHSDYVAMPEGRVHYYEAAPLVAGGGIPLVLVHGIGDRAESWAPMLERLKHAGFRVYAPDLLGSGRSPRPADSDYSIATEEQFVVDFIQALGLQRPDIGGWSMGGYVTLKLALDHPDLVDRVVVYDPVGIRFTPDYPTTVFQLKDEAAVVRLGLLLEPRAKPVPSFVQRDIVRYYATQQWVVDREMADIMSAKDVLDERLGGFPRPLLLVWGSDDKLLPLELGRKMHTMDPRSELDIVEGCGHLLPKTCPDRVAAATADFLKAQPVPEGQVRTLTKMR